jgi:adenylate cyclase
VQEVRPMVSPVSEATARCRSCGNDLRAKARFCDMCGSAVSPRAAAGEHKQVTVLFADVVGSMKLAARLDPERLQAIMNELFNQAAMVVQRYQGTVDKFTGDGLMALFGAPVALEDHALRACIAALEIQSATEELAAEVLRRDHVAFQIRVGVSSGEVIAGEIGSGPGRYTAVGHPVGMAQRMEAAAPVGGVLCSLFTARLVEDATCLGGVEDVSIKGTEAPVPARQLLAVESDRIVLGRTEGLMLGRDAELSSLQMVFNANRGCLLGIIGAPGVGKSRLISEFTAIASNQTADVVVARCEAHTTTLAFRAVSRLLRAMFGVFGLSDADAREHTAAQCGEALLTPRSADTQFLFDAMGIADAIAPPLQVSGDGRRHRLVTLMARAVLARSARTVFVLEDAHWIDAPSDDVLADFAATLEGTTSMFLTTYRPEFRGALHRQTDQTITLQPLSGAIAVRLVSQVLGGDPSLGGLAERIAAAAAGNPFFAEEIVRDLAGRGVLLGSRGGYRLTGDLDEITVPATVQAVLAARIDRLPAPTKSILNAAAVIGTHFDVDTLHALRPDTESARLAELVSAELIDQIQLVPLQRYCFHHPLVRTVAYESQMTVTRVQAHRRLATAIEARDPSAEENAALIATHLEAAGELAEAYRWHLRAARWLRPRDLPAARAAWENARRIADQLPDDYDDVTALRIAPRAMLISTTLYVSDDVGADDRYRELRDLTLGIGDLTSLALATAGRVWSLSANDIRVPEAATLASELEDMVSSITCDAPTKAIILNSVAFARFAECEFDAALQVIDAILALTDDVPMAEIAPAQALRGVIEICLGDSKEGRRHLREGIKQARTLTPLHYALISHYSGPIAALGMCKADEWIDDTREALRRAESFGEVSGIIAAQWAHGTVLLRAENASHDEAIGLLERAHAMIQKHKVFVIALATVGADLATDAASKGRRDEAIQDLRASFLLQIGSGSRVLVGCTGEALIELLVERGSIDDLTEAHRIVDRWQARRPGIPAIDLWAVKSCALLAKAAGDLDGYFDQANAYLALCEKLGARGRLPAARRMVDESLQLRQG